MTKGLLGVKVLGVSRCRVNLTEVQLLMRMVGCWLLRTREQNSLGVRATLHRRAGR